MKRLHGMNTAQAAVNTLAAPRTTMLLARLFGRRAILHDAALPKACVAARWRGRYYLMEKAPAEERRMQDKSRSDWMGIE